jgi:hypothetical protein
MGQRDTNSDPVPLYVDSSGEPVLDASGNKQWKPDYLYNSKDWKAGPVDLKWDETRGVWVGGAGETQIINFQIASSDPTTRSAIVQIEQRAFKGTAYGSFLEGEVVYVYDTDGCYLNEPSVDLTARRGKAVLMYTDDAAAALHFSGDYSPPEKYWCVLSICCPNASCETI